MSKPTIFMVSTIWDAETGVWSGQCEEIPAAADAPTLDELLNRIALMAVDLAPLNYPGMNPEQISIQLAKPHGRKTEVV